MRYDCIIIGGGASGLMAAVTAARAGKQVLVLEKRSKAGKKLAMTGNGRCNLTNLKQHPAFYHSRNQDFPLPVLDHFSSSQVIAFFSELGLFTKNRDGYIYPHTEEAFVVAELLEAELRRHGGKLKCSAAVSAIRKADDYFKVTVEDWQYEASTVILATGSYAGFSETDEAGESADSWNHLAAAFGHHLIRPLPALVPLLSDDPLLPAIGTLRIDAACTLRIDAANLATERGNVQFTGKGISGIPVFQLSAAAVRAIATGHRVEIRVNLLPDFEPTVLSQYLQQRSSRAPQKTVSELLLGLVPKKMIAALKRRSALDGSRNGSTLTTADFDRLVDTLLRFDILIAGYAPAAQAQVLQGGIDTREVFPMTLESRLVQGLFFAGEALDVDAVCGGYNLHWAWSSGYVAGHLGNLQDTLYPLEQLTINHDSDESDYQND
ncbi:MAG: NAD(P)/FAD-dependent oxidoreductase [Lachnospiraceae bacterium]|nr:NAD(P)/FAD-dependent oxidoreductase [Lachnospiraceae bacterium]MDY5741789.1 NAD(P)/FAD-dependent oxidoreductase [Lachnospiraceae bacterium]